MSNAKNEKVTYMNYQPISPIMGRIKFFTIFIKSANVVHRDSITLGGFHSGLAI